MSNQESSGNISSYTFRNFIRRLNNAAIRRKYREEQLAEIGERMRTLSSLSIAKKPSRRKIDKELDNLRLNIEEAVAQDKLIGLKQKSDESEIEELRRKIERLEERIEGLSHVHSFVSDKHSQRIAELQSSIRKAISEKEELQQMPDEEIKRFVLEKVKPLEEAGKRKIKTKRKTKPKKVVEKARAKKIIKKAKPPEAKPKIHPMVIKSLKKKISDAEKLHSRLEKRGHPKEDLERLRKVIDGHKEKLDRLK